MGIEWQLQCTKSILNVSMNLMGFLKLRMLSLFKCNFNLTLKNNFTCVLRKFIYDVEVFVPRANWLKRHCYVECC